MTNNTKHRWTDTFHACAVYLEHKAYTDDMDAWAIDRLHIEGAQQFIARCHTEGVHVLYRKSQEFKTAVDDIFSGAREL